MKLGNKIFLIILFSFNCLQAEQKITETPLINIDKIKPSFDNLDLKEENTKSSKKLRKKKLLKTLNLLRLYCLG